MSDVSREAHRLTASPVPFCPRCNLRPCYCPGQTPQAHVTVTGKVTLNGKPWPA